MDPGQVSPTLQREIESTALVAAVNAANRALDAKQLRLCSRKHRDGERLRELETAAASRAKSILRTHRAARAGFAIHASLAMRFAVGGA